MLCFYFTQTFMLFPFLSHFELKFLLNVNPCNPEADLKHILYNWAKICFSLPHTVHSPVLFISFFLEYLCDLFPLNSLYVLVSCSIFRLCVVFFKISSDLYRSLLPVKTDTQMWRLDFQTLAQGM